MTAHAAALPDVSDEAIAALGITQGAPQMRGFVFIDGKYLAPPYTVSRRGNGIFINRVQVEQPVPWVSATQPERKKALDDDGDFEVVDADDDAKPAARAVEKDELLFGDAEDTDGKKEEAHAIDALFDDTPKKKTPEKKPAPAPRPTASQPKQQVEELKAKLDTLRKNYETAIGKGDIYFFSQKHSRVNGTYGSAKTLFAVLPSALRSAKSPQDLMAKLNQGGVYFLDLAVCTELFKNDNRVGASLELEKRQKQIEAEDAAKRPAVRR